jgi:hypothetical protein
VLNIFLSGTRGPLHSGAPKLCLPCLPYCYATEQDTSQYYLHIYHELKALTSDRIIFIVYLSRAHNFTESIRRRFLVYYRYNGYGQLTNETPPQKRGLTSVR